MDAIKALQERRSIKRFKPEPIPEKELNEILAAGMNAPTGGNTQSPVMVVTSDPEVISELSRLNAAAAGVEADREMFYGAPTLVVVLVDTDLGKTCVEDGSLVMGNLLNAAYALGIGSRWIHRAKQVFDSEEGKALLKSWGLHGNYVGIGHCILGYPADVFPAAVPRKEGYVVRI